MGEVIVFGVDSHAASLAICGVDQAGRACVRGASSPTTRLTTHAACVGA